MGKKYIVELLDDCPSEFKGIIVFGLTPEGQISAEPIPVEDLTPYTEPDVEQVRKEGYEKGWNEAKDYYYDNGYGDGYYEGLGDAWEAARKIQDTGGNLNWWIHNTSASNAIEKIRQYEQRQEEQIQVGDEVATDAGNRASVLYENPDGTQVFVFKSDGTAAWWTKSALHRTGRNFFEIATVLKKMQGEQDG